MNSRVPPTARFGVAMATHRLGDRRNYIVTDNIRERTRKYGQGVTPAIFTVLAHRVTAALA